MILNEKNDKTKKIIHLLVTSLCDRDCKYCCNKQYDLNDIPQVTEEELSECETVCITGGEPFAYAKPWEIAYNLKTNYSNIKRVYVYTNAKEFDDYLSHLYLIHHDTTQCYYVDGYNISLKNEEDCEHFNGFLAPALNIINKIFCFCRGYELSNRLYIQTKVDKEIIERAKRDGFEIIKRNWQKEFVPCDDSIFRRL